MNFVWLCLALSLQFCPHSIVAGGFFHEPSMRTIHATVPDKSYFGYSISYERFTKRLLVSAPHYDVDGKVFRCRPEDGTCELVKIDVIKKYTIPDHYAWLGATVLSGPTYSVVCAPRTVDDVAKSVFKEKGTLGACYSLSQNGTATNITPISQNDRFAGTSNSGIGPRMTSFGWSIEIASDNSIAIGGPAMGSGKTIVYDNDSAFTKPPRLIKWEQTNREAKVNHNFGYSIASGNFFSDDTNDVYYAVGTTYGKNGTGKVLLFNRELKYKAVLLAEGVGTMYGAALGAARLGDSRAALLVGAPGRGADEMYDVGAVYVYLSDGTSMKFHKLIPGSKQGGRFGTAILNLGDMDADQHDEIAISAPYEESGRGAVYVFTGAALRDGITAPAQRLQPAARAAGLSLTTIPNLDYNGCKALAVGAPESDSVHVYRCFPTITPVVTAHIQNGTGQFPLKSCIGVENYPKGHAFKAEFNMTLVLSHKNAYIESPDKKYRAIITNTAPVHCKTFIVVTPSAGDYNKPIGYKISAKLVNDPMLGTWSPLGVVVSERSQLLVDDKWWVGTCDGSTECKPNFSDINVRFDKTHYVVGSSSSEVVSFEVKNLGDTAYAACARVTVSGAPVSRAAHCKPADNFNKHTRICQPAKPVINNSTWTQELSLDTSKLSSKDEVIIVTVYLYNHCPSSSAVECLEPDCKSIVHRIPLHTDRHTISVKGVTDLGVIVNLTKSETEDEHKRINHKYTISNNGVTNWDRITCKITLEELPYIRYNPIISVQASDASSSCTLVSPVTFCDISGLNARDKADVSISMDTIPEELAKFISTRNGTVTTSLQVVSIDPQRSDKITTTLWFPDTSVSTWVLVAACLFGLFLVFIIAVILYKCGILKRQNHKKLEDLKRSVHRQSMIMPRRSNTRVSTIYEASVVGPELSAGPSVIGPSTRTPTKMQKTKKRKEI